MVWSCQTLVYRKQGVQEKLKLRLEMTSGLQMSGKSAGGLQQLEQRCGGGKRNR